MGLFPDQNINWYQKLTCDDPKPSLSFCLPIVATVAKGRGTSISFDGCHAPPALWVCSTSSFVDLLPKAPQGKSKSSARLKKNLKKYFIYIYSKKPPVEKIAQNWAWQGIAMPYHCRDGDWLTEAPVFQNGGGSGSWHKSTRDPNSPGVNHPHDNPPSPPYGRGRGHRTHQEALTVFVVNLWNTISMLLTTGTPHSWMIQVRPEKTLYYILFYLYSLRLVPNGYFIRDTSSITRY